jgi:NAD(P)-dependent dehydrogenase (short-subunit alcohol dehydrogenase family)
MRLTDGSAVVSGGVGGLGEATVRRLAGAGMSVVIADLDDEKGSALAKELGSSVVYVRTDVTSEESLLETLGRANELNPLRVSVAAHGGGGGLPSRVVNREGEPMSLAVFEETIRVFLTGTFNLMRLAAATMAKNDVLDDGARGVVINTASIAAYEGQVGQAPYAAAKAGVVGLTLVAARDLSPVGVRVMTIAPGTFYTPAFRLPEEEAQERWGTGVPFPRRMGRASEYAALVEHIASNDYLNGEVIRIDGAIRFGLK